MAAIESEVWQQKAERQFIDFIYMFSDKTGMSLRTLAKLVHVDPSYFPKVKAGIIHYSSDLDSSLSRVHWMLNLAIWERISGGLFINPLRIDPDMSLEPSCLKESLSDNLEEATNALKKLRAYQKYPDRDAALKTIYESMDVLMEGNVLIGVLSEKIGVSRSELIEGYKKHKRDEHRR
ncbi:hypothetical protein [Sporolactobacillus laevolacticus]|uniref:Uncharacterized protein n=1 Tax=Sporolactobacillus laevolacticus DSM 442 TaxID=1395513 RepID=V6J3K2_9BACL|nr:hypothetical protein [Sporolactobacillus laevolacticus]EST11284.1 hypothetical protein P343_12840 [Sporolactobacillus laevolacticus DSM 442]